MAEHIDDRDMDAALDRERRRLEGRHFARLRGGRSLWGPELLPGEVDLRPGHGRFFGRGPKGYRRSEDRIREEICDRLTTHPDIDASDVEVTISHGVVSLTGTVDTRHEKRIAELVADDTVGVDDVDNRLRVRRGFWSSLASGRDGDMEGERPVRREADRGSRSAHHRD